MTRDECLQPVQVTERTGNYDHTGDTILVAFDFTHLTDGVVSANDPHRRPSNQPRRGARARTLACPGQQMYARAW